MNCVRVLLDNGADIASTDEYGKTPMQTAELSSKHGALKVLRSAGESIYQHKYRIVHILHYCIWHSIK